MHIVKVDGIDSDVIFQENWLGTAVEGEYFIGAESWQDVNYESADGTLFDEFISVTGSETLDILPMTMGFCAFDCSVTAFQPTTEFYNIELIHFEASSCIISGCTYEGAVNFNALAQVDDGSCIMMSLPGGCEEDVDADCICDNIDPCIGVYDALGVCNGDCHSDTNGNGVCDEEEEGCTYPLAYNFSSESYFDNGTCVFDFFVSCPGDYNGDYFIGISDLLMLLSGFNTWCND